MHSIPMRIAAAAALAAGAGLLSGCVATTPDWDRHFGEAARLALGQQVLRPDGGRNRDPVAGLDGPAAAAVQARYLKSYAEPAPQPAVFTIGVSGAK
ncbi:hypothetical protein ACFOLJ_08415 [Rugamonas sp. CCM 8940]|uniref:hypothetical protein n=1 Tax=Rugamonas sp. CCM 8940 TaxID=2765359 RepID=UPI0018F637DE|nr:hypothetical protein [Rugamonas sp. CCM 8940]MBJ7309509.1 hypothetical protein [Rugamonas sp. CCM 8940]